jgi:hypothetical protein
MLLFWLLIKRLEKATANLFEGYPYWVEHGFIVADDLVQVSA